MTGGEDHPVLAELAAMDSEAIDREAQLEASFLAQDWNAFDAIVEAEYQAEKSRYDNVNDRSGTGPDGGAGPSGAAIEPGESSDDVGAHKEEIPAVESTLEPLSNSGDGSDGGEARGEGRSDGGS